jgi:DNA-directed RNA polymerase specialized sigma24 family protein
VLQLKYAQGQKIAEISAGMEKSVAAVEMMLVRSRRSLRACVERKMSQAAPEAL